MPLSAVWRSGQALTLTIALAGGIGVAGSAAAQEVRFRSGSGGHTVADQAARRILSRGGYRIISQDTLIESHDVVESDLVVVRSTVHVEGRIVGDLLAVESDVFARPGAQIEGLVVVLSGGFYGSALADLRTPPIDASLYDYRVEVSGSVYRIAGPGGQAGLELPGFYGFTAPTYDRVNAITVEWGLNRETGRRRGLREVAGRLRYRSGREQVDGAVRLEGALGPWGFGLSGGRTVRTPDGWIQGDLFNSIHSLVATGDVRNYYDARFAEFGVTFARGVEVGYSYDVVVGWERARSLASRDPFSVFSDRQDFQANLPVDEGDVGSVRIGAGLRWPTPEPALLVELAVDHADGDVVGDFSYTLVVADASARLRTWGRQSLRLRAVGQGVLSGEPPGQRWRSLGGWGTLPTAPRLGRRGPRMWWVQAVYAVSGLADRGLLSVLEPYLEYAAGDAWSTADHAGALHCLGLGVRLSVLTVGVYVDPDSDFESVIVLGLRSDRPRGRR